MIDFHNPNNTSTVLFELDSTLPELKHFVDVLAVGLFEPEIEGKEVFSLNISADIASFIYTEKQFTHITDEEISYLDIFGKEFYENMKTHQEALGSIDVIEKTPAYSYQDDFNIYDPADLQHALSSLLNFLDSTLWFANRSCLHASRGMIMFLLVISKLCDKYKTYMKVIGPI